MAILTLNDSEAKNRAVNVVDIGSNCTATNNIGSINAALSLGGRVEIYANVGSTSETILINKTLTIYSNTHLYVGPGVTIKLADSSSCHMFRNASAHESVNVQGITLTGGTSITVPCPGNTRSVGDVVFVEGFTGNTSLNGAKSLTAVVPGVSITYAASGSNPTNGATTPRAYISTYYKGIGHSGTNFVRAANVVTVTEVGHQRQIGDMVYIAALGGANSFNGPKEITNVTAGISWTYANAGANETATGTAQLLGDYNIHMDINRLDCNSAGQVYEDFYANSVIYQSVSRCSFNCKHLDNNASRGFSPINFSNFESTYIGGVNNFVVVQIEGPWNRVRFGKVYCGKGTGGAWASNVTALGGVNSNVAPATGNGNCDNLTIDTLEGYDCEETSKITAATGYDMGRIRINNLVGDGLCTFGDATDTFIGGGSAASISIGKVALANSQLNFANAWSLIKNVRIEHYTAPLDATGQWLSFGARINNVEILSVVDHTKNTHANGAMNFTVSGQTFDRVYFGHIDTSAGNSGKSILIGTNVTINDFFCDDVYFVGDASNTGDFIQLNAGANVKRFHFGRVSSHSGRSFLRFAATSVGPTDIHVGSHSWSDLSSVYNDGGGTQNVNIFADSISGATLVNNVFQTNGSGTWKIKVGSMVHPAGKLALLNSGTPNVSIDCTTAQLDMGANAGAPPARLIPVAGDRLWNTNAVGTGLYGRTAAGAWQLIF
jgi:hypothetical protein